MASMFMPGLVGEDTVAEAPGNNLLPKARHNADKEVIEHGPVLTESIFQRRKLEVANLRRKTAAYWLQEVVGPLDMLPMPSEADLKNCLRNGVVLCRAMNFVEPGIIDKILENARGPLTPCKGQSLIQNFENIRTFIEAAERLRIPTFEPNTFEQDVGGPQAMSAVVDCILGLKRHHESKLLCQLSTVDNGMSTPIQPSSPREREVPPVTPTSLRSDLMSGWDRGYMGYRAKGLESPSTPRTGLPGENSDLFPGGPTLNSAITIEESSDSPDEADSTADIIFSVSRALRQQVNTKRLVTNSAKNCQPSPSKVSSPSKVNLRSIFSKLIRPDATHDDILPVLEMVVQTLMREFESRVVAHKHQLERLGAEKKMLMQELQQKERTLTAGPSESRAELDNLEEERMRLRAELEALAVERQQAIELAQRSEQAERDVLEQMASMESSTKEISAKLVMSEAQELDFHVTRARLEHFEGIHRELLPQRLAEVKELKALLHKTKADMGLLQDHWMANVKAVDEHVASLSKAAGGYYKVVAENRRLYNELQELRGNIRVYCRVRPILGASAGKNTIVDRCENGDIMVSNPLKGNTRKTFTFDKVFNSETSQEQVFADTQPLIRSVLDGFNVCLFAYGQTGSGKTHTMMGPSNMSEDQWGVNNRALRDLFALARERSERTKYEVAVQMVEIYNEQVRDLLCKDPSKQRLEIRSTSQPNGMQVPDATLEPVESMESVLRVMAMGQRTRSVGSTALNDRSSRSHSVLTIHVTGKGVQGAPNTKACLHLVDLAGSERVDRSEVVGERLREAQHINKSLSALGDVIAALATKSAHVPYRNSKLTQILQDSLGGHSKTVMFVHISPEVESFGESLSTLKFAERVSSVELGVAQSNSETSELRELREMVINLKEKLAEKERDFDHQRQVTSPAGVPRLLSAPSPGKRLSVGQTNTGKKAVDSSASCAEEVRSRIFSRQSVDGSLQVRKRNPNLMRSMLESPLPSAAEPGALAGARYLSPLGKPSPIKGVPDIQSCQESVHVHYGREMQASNSGLNTASALGGKSDGQVQADVSDRLLELTTPLSSAAGLQFGGCGMNEKSGSSMEGHALAQESSDTTICRRSTDLDCLGAGTSLRERDSNVQMSVTMHPRAESPQRLSPTSIVDMIEKGLNNENIETKLVMCMDKCRNTSSIKDELGFFASLDTQHRREDGGLEQRALLSGNSKTGIGGLFSNQRYAEDVAEAAPDVRTGVTSDLGSGSLLERIAMVSSGKDVDGSATRSLDVSNSTLSGAAATHSSLDCGVFSIGASSGGFFKRRIMKQETADAALLRSKTVGHTSSVRKGGQNSVAPLADSAAAQKRIALTVVEADGSHHRTAWAVSKPGTPESTRNAAATPSTAGASATVPRRLSLVSGSSTTPSSGLSTPKCLLSKTPAQPPSTVQSKAQRVHVPSPLAAAPRLLSGGASRVPSSGASSVRRVIDRSKAEAEASHVQILQGSPSEASGMPNILQVEGCGNPSPAESSGSGWSSASQGTLTNDTESGQSSGASSGFSKGSYSNQPKASSISPECISAPKKRMSGGVPKYVSSSMTSATKERLGSWSAHSGLGHSFSKESERKSNGVPSKSGARRSEVKRKSWTPASVQRGSSSEPLKPDGRRLWK